MLSKFPASRPACARTREGRRTLARKIYGATFLLLAVGVGSVAAAKTPWKPVAPDELAETAPRLEQNAAAEVLLDRVEVDDRDYPRERRITRYVRYKIFAPDRAETVTKRVLRESTTGSRHFELVARLMLPSGEAHEFGRESMQEQSERARAGQPGLLEWLLGPAPEIRERFLAIRGVVRGAVLDYVITETVAEPGPVETVRPQTTELPVRRFEYVCQLATEGNWTNRTYVFNNGSNALQHDERHHVVSFAASDLPTLRYEPLLGPPTDYAVIVKNCYESTVRTVPLRGGGNSLPIDPDEKAGPWAVHATFLDWFSRDRADPTRRVRQLATQITAGATDPEAKARAIHDYVTSMSQKYRRRPGPHPKATEKARSLDDVLDVEKMPTVQRPPEEFLWLTLGLYRAAGLECCAVMLPDRTDFRFDAKEIGRRFLPGRAIAVRLGGSWRFSYPQGDFALPFGLLPWEYEGQVALLGLEHTAQFIPVPAAPANVSVAATTGDFSIAEDGTLSGECRRTFTGHAAVRLRGQLRSANNKEKRTAVLLQCFGLDPRVVTLTPNKPQAIEDPEQPLVVSCTLRWPGFATVTKDRLIVRAAILQADTANPFTATQRRYPVQFPFAWTKSDHLVIHLPAGFAPDAPDAPAPLPTGDLNYALKLAVDAAHTALHVDREFSSNVLDVPVSRYPALKACFDHIARADQHEVVFRRTSPGSSTAEAAP